MKYRREDNTVIVSAEELSKYTRPKRNMNDPSAGFERVNYNTEAIKDNDRLVSSRTTISNESLYVEIETEADYVTNDSGIISVWTVEYKKKLPLKFTAYYSAELLAKSIINGYTYCKSHGLDNINVRIIYKHKNDSDCAIFEKNYDIGSLKLMTEGIISRAMPFLTAYSEREGIVREELSKLSFPFKNVRAGQEQLMMGVIKTLRKGGMLVSSAPTGTGKTMATIYPSLKALAERYIDRIFYITCKGTTGKAAYDAMKLIGEKASHVRTIMINSKERSCSSGGIKNGCEGCPKISEYIFKDNVISYEQRRDMALEELLKEYYQYDGKIIADVAGKYDVCAYELSLDLSEYCDLIICDLNYIFDSKIRFYRYFKKDRGEKYAFLVDEAHNLPDRIRSTYSADITAEDLSEVAELVLTEQCVDDELSHALAKCADEFNKLKASTSENGSEKLIGGNTHFIGFEKQKSIPETFIKSIALLNKVCYSKTKEIDEFTSLFKALYEKTSQFLRSAEFFEEGFVFVSSLYDNTIKCSSVCLDPSRIISKMCESAYSTVMFSATLSPGEYFADSFGYKGNVLEAESPFEPEHLCVTVYDGVSTRLSDRRLTAADVAEVIYTVVTAKQGNYFVYFPSYKYMKMVARELLGAYPEIRAVMQREGMSNSEKEKFLSTFTSQKYNHLLGFCVLGGVFSEGVDLVGDSLIGVIVVGAGLSGLSSELNLISEYYGEKYEKGYEYSYLYPAINKIEQAAGRVIRTAEDRGCVVMIDDRLADPNIIKAFPTFWQPIKCTSDLTSLNIILERFWENNKKV